VLHNLSRCVWLIPTPEFRLAACESRGSIWSIPNKTSNPERALSNPLERDRLFTARVKDMGEHADLPVINVDGPMAESVLNLAATQFGLQMRNRGLAAPDLVPQTDLPTGRG